MDIQHKYNKCIHDRSLSWLGTCTSIKRGGVKIVLRMAQFSMQHSTNHGVHHYG